MAPAPAAPVRAPSPGKAASGTRAEWESELAAQREELVQAIDEGIRATQADPEKNLGRKPGGFAATVDDALQFDELILPPHTELVSFKQNFNTHMGHYGEMASWQMRGVSV